MVKKNFAIGKYFLRERTFAYQPTLAVIPATLIKPRN